MFSTAVFVQVWGFTHGRESRSTRGSCSRGHPEGALRINPSGDLNQPPSTMCFVMQKQVSLFSASARGKRNPRLRTRSPGGYLCRWLPGCFPAAAAACDQIRIFRSSAQGELIPNTHSPPTPGFVTCEPCGGTQPCVASHRACTRTMHGVSVSGKGRRPIWARCCE